MAWRARRQAARRRRRTRGVLRRVDPWSVFRVSLIFYVAMYCVLVVAGVLLWRAATFTGFRGNVESFIAGLTESGEFRFVGDELFRASIICGAVLAVMGTGANVVFAVLYNLISDVVGGVVVVVEEKPSRRALDERVDAASPEAPEGAPAGADAETADERASVPSAAAAAAVMPGVVGGAGTAAATPAPAVADFGLGSLGPRGRAAPSGSDVRTE